jgi:hypothetical protein
VAAGTEKMTLPGSAIHVRRFLPALPSWVVPRAVAHQSSACREPEGGEPGRGEERAAEEPKRAATLFFLGSCNSQSKANREPSRAARKGEEREPRETRGRPTQSRDATRGCVPSVLCARCAGAGNFFPRFLWVAWVAISSKAEKFRSS